jgi:CBS domain containing-hemolysin-like protein
MPNNPPDPTPSSKDRLFMSLRRLWRKLKGQDTENTLRETLEELIEEGVDESSSIASDERELLGNVLNLRDLTAEDVMVPRIDIIAIPQDATEEELLGTLIRSRLKRLPVYKNTLDEVIGMIQIKDVLAWKASGKPLNIKSIIRDVLFISPTARTLDILFQMRESGTKMALVVDEYGGIDGLVSFSDLIEEIIGDIQDAQDRGSQQQLIKRSDGSILADGRIALEEIEENFGLRLVDDDLADEVDTIGGLVTTLAGRVPNRGELIKHPHYPVEFEVLDADPRRIKRICIREKKEQS